MAFAIGRFGLANAEFYAPVESADSDSRGAAYRPAQVPDGWQERQSDVWTRWCPDGQYPTPGEGWKVHVSAGRDRVRQILDIAAGVCFSQQVPFKHLSAPLFYRLTNSRHASRSQAGKFITAYPADVPSARTLMEALREALADEVGPYVLSDRRYRDSRTVYYRYGGFASTERLRPDGTRELLIRDGTGRLVPDRRGVSFYLPEGITDPFALPQEAGPVPGGDAAGDGPLSLYGFVIESPIRHSNAGGTYRARYGETGRQVCIKEARPHTGLLQADMTATEQLRAEWQVLAELHDLSPGLAPEPVAYLRVWEHEFLVMEYIKGISLTSLVARQHPVLLAGKTADDFAVFYDRAQRILAAIGRALDRLHELGYFLVDVSPSNVLIAPDDSVRLIDFGTAHRQGTPLKVAGTLGYSPPGELAGDDPAVYDEYGLAALAQLLVSPMHQVVRRNPGSLRYLHYDLSERAPIPPALWQRATRFHQPEEEPRLPDPEQVAADPVRHLTGLRDAAADALISMTDLENPDRVYPTVPRGFAANTLCVLYGTAGVVHALRRAGRTLPDGVVGRFRRDAAGSAGRLAPGLYTGLAGIAWVLADLGFVDEARDLLTMADQHPLTRESATLSGGSAGVALAHLALYGHTRDESHLDRAIALAAAIPSGDDLIPRLGPDNGSGLLHGRCGIALMLQQLAAATGDTAWLPQGVSLLHAELGRASDPDAPGLLFPVSGKDRRQMPYLAWGSAGMALTVSRYLQVTSDEQLASSLPRLLAPLHGAFTVHPALFNGAAGFAYVLADCARRTGREDHRQAALRAARRLFKHAIPGATGVRFLGDQLERYSAELWSGSAGIVLALTHVLSPQPDALFTVDRLAVADPPTPAATPAMAGARPVPGN